MNDYIMNARPEIRDKKIVYTGLEPTYHLNIFIPQWVLNIEYDMQKVLKHYAFCKEQFLILHNTVTNKVHSDDKCDNQHKECQL